MSLNIQQLVDGLQHPVIQEHLGEVAMQVTVLLLSDSLDEVDKAIISSRLLVFETLDETEVSSAVKELRNVIEVLLAESPERLKMTKAYFEKYAKIDYEACAKANEGRVRTHRRNKFKCVNSEILAVNTYLRRLQTTFDFDGFGILGKWRKLADLEIFASMDQNYFEKHAKIDYEACADANDGRVNTMCAKSFQCGNNEYLFVQAYLSRLKTTFSLDDYSGIVGKWRELAGLETFTSMDQSYFEKHAKADYEACADANEGKVNSMCSVKFKCVNNELLSFQTYLDRIRLTFNFDGYSGLADKWKALAEGRFIPGGIQASEQAQQLLLGEIKRMKSDDGEITQADWDEILKPKYYQSNVVVQECIDFLSKNIKK